MRPRCSVDAGRATRRFSDNDPWCDSLHLRAELERIAPPHLLRMEHFAPPPQGNEAIGKGGFFSVFLDRPPQNPTRPVGFWTTARCLQCFKSAGMSVFDVPAPIAARPPPPLEARRAAFGSSKPCTPHNRRQGNAQPSSYRHRCSALITKNDWNRARLDRCRQWLHHISTFPIPKRTASHTNTTRNESYKETPP